MASYDDTATVSGSVATFADGADEVGLKSCKITLPASLSGVSAVTETQTGSKNLMGFPSVDFTHKGVHYYTIDGVLYLDGTTVGETSSVDDVFRQNLTFYLPAGTYYLTRGNIALPTYIYDIDNIVSGQAIRTNNGTFTLAEGKWLVLGFYLYQKTFSNSKADIMVNEGSTAIAYEDANAPDTYTANLGRTIYGGEVDIVNGTGTDENGNDFTFTGQEVPTRLGYNAFWSEQGNTEVTYYKDGYGFTSVTVHKETPDGEPVEETMKLHRVIYGGLVDVISGKAEPKNILLPSSTDSSSTVVNGVARSYSLDSQTWVLEGTNTKTDANWLIYNGANYVLSKELVVGDTFTYSHTLSANCYSQFTYKDTNGATRALGYLAGNANKNASVTFTIPANFVELLRFQIGVVRTATSVSEEAVFQLEKASSKTEYAPYFEPFTFPPIIMKTDEGENTLYADEGDSVITYRKDTD